MVMRWIIDSGHGWLEVPLADYPDAVECGSGFGYIDRVKGLIYLEEDMEAGLFAHRHGREILRGIRQRYVDGEWQGRWTLPNNEARVDYDAAMVEMYGRGE